MVSYLLDASGVILTDGLGNNLVAFVTQVVPLRLRLHG